MSEQDREATAGPDEVPHEQELVEDPITNWQRALHPNIRRIFENLRQDMEKMEASILRAENEVFKKEEEAFFQRQDEYEITELQKQQADELLRMTQNHHSMILERKHRKKTKALLSETQKEAKSREVKIRQQEHAQRLDNQVKEVLSQHRECFDALVQHIEARHERQRAQLVASQDRKMRDQRALLEIETRSLEPGIREEILKDFTFRLVHQNTLNKIAVDQLIEIQQLELNRRKEQFDAESEGLEANAYLKVQNIRKVYVLEAQQKVEYSKEKGTIAEAREKIKMMQLESQYKADLKKLKTRHKMALRQLVRNQKQRAATRLGKWKEVIADENADKEQTPLQKSPSAASVSDMSRSASCSMSTADFSSTFSLDEGAVSEDAREQSEAEAAIQSSLLMETKQAEEELMKIQEVLKQVAQKQKDEMSKLRQEQQQQVKDLEDAHQKELDELSFMQDTEIRALKKSHEMTLLETMASQQREHQMEASIRATERRTMTERRTLNSVLDNVMDGIINIDTSGTITRINHAVETMFRYSADEVLNQNVKMLVPSPYSENHDTYLLNYLRTRIPKLIGTGRKVEGRKKDGSLFPIYVSVSEVREEEFHIFTGVVRDLTEVVAAEEAAAAEEARKNLEMEKLVAQLEDARIKSKKVIETIIPSAIAEQLLKNIPIPPKNYEDVTILFTDICGFTELSSASEPLDIVELLNDIYSCFDEIIDLYDCYKVETIGDSYMVASGVPKLNGSQHLSEISKLALHLLKAVQTIKIRHKPSAVLKMRLGIHTGPVVAGVVGRKMPRYCLFGDTVSIASRMESAGLPMKIQVSETTYERLEKIGGFHFETRGEMHMPGRPSFRTYFLTSKDDFDPVVNPVSLEKNPLSKFLRSKQEEEEKEEKTLEAQAI